MIRIAIVEDEERAADTLSKYLTQFGAESDQRFSVTRCADPVALLDRYSGYDLIFMDIEMPHMNGMEGARRLRELDSEVKLVFVTNMAQYAAKGYEVEAMDFIVKPVAYSDFAFKMKRVMSALRRNERRELVIAQPGGIVRVSSDDLAYVEIRGHKLTYHLLDRILETRGTMDSAGEALSGADFLRPHNCYLVNPKYIDWIRGYTVSVCGEELMISHPRRREFMAELSRWYTKGGG